MQPSLDDITVIVVTFNSAHCIPALTPTLGVLPHVIFVDNASNDGTIEAVHSALPHADIIANKRNLGFGAANNRALEKTKTRFALLLNPDCLPEIDALHQLLAAAAEFPDAAIIAPHLIKRNGGIEVSYRWPHNRWLSCGPAAEGPCCVGFACGAVLLLNMQQMRDVGYFDEAFFLYYEDEDLCQRAFDARKQIVIAPSVGICHLSRGSVKGNTPLKAEFGRGYHHAQS
ncbi:glycosyltransferase family 2 protein, partial [uncultured Oxalicibacterium sp.]|uniref:glycosyltransferase family 2 protein n=1 Tax=uncultured Oxalicibacterium sp. TaxID=1168540 RepID=UPI0026008A87